MYLWMCKNHEIPVSLKTNCPKCVDAGITNFLITINKEVVVAKTIFQEINDSE